MIGVLCRKASLQNYNNAVMTMLSYEAADSYIKGDQLRSIHAEALHIAKNFQFASLLCIFALSGAIQTPIVSFYKSKDDFKIDHYEALFNCSISLRLQECVLFEKIYIFCCSSLPVTFRMSGKFCDKKNH